LLLAGGLSGTPAAVSQGALDTEELFEWERWGQAHMNAAHSDSDRGRYLQEAQADGSKVAAAAPSCAAPRPAAVRAANSKGREPHMHLVGGHQFINLSRGKAESQRATIGALDNSHSSLPIPSAPLLITPPVDLSAPGNYDFSDYAVRVAWSAFSQL
jgi:hypothetical protein